MTIDPVHDEVCRLIDRTARRVSNFPQAGVNFVDLTPVLADAQSFRLVISALADWDEEVDVVAGLDARGFLLAAAVALQRGTGVLAIRKSGKLPPPILSQSYDLEYGSATLEIPGEGVDLQGKRILIVDDVLATGGTARAAKDLLESAGAIVAGVAVILEISALNGRDKLSDISIKCLKVE